MCGRFLTPDEAAFERHWGIVPPVDFSPSYNVAPSQLVPVIRLNADGIRQADMFVWNFRPGWAKRSWINARAETAWTNRAFASAAEKRRCLVPAVGWYEWQADRTPKQPYALYMGDFCPFSFAGIWTARRLDTGWQHSFAILTREAAPAIAQIHRRMPAVIHPTHYEAWLSPDTSVQEAQRIALEHVGTLSAYPVSTFVNKPEHDEARCIEPLSP